MIPHTPLPMFFHILTFNEAGEEVRAGRVYDHNDEFDNLSDARKALRNYPSSCFIECPHALDIEPDGTGCRFCGKE